MATLKFAGGPAMEVKIDDISRGGIGLWHDCTEKVGTDAEITLPGGAVIGGRIARIAGGVVAFAFRQDAASLAGIERTLAHIRAHAMERAA